MLRDDKGIKMTLISTRHVEGICCGDIIQPRLRCHFYFLVGSWVLEKERKDVQLFLGGIEDGIFFFGGCTPPPFFCCPSVHEKKIVEFLLISVKNIK